MTGPKFPGRPDHADFWLMAEVVQDLDTASDDGTSFARLVGPLVDPQSIAYMAQQRGLRAYTMLKGGGETRMAATWLDGFIAGMLYQKRKTERATGE